MKANFQADLEKAKKAAKDTKGMMTAAASKMFFFYANLFFGLEQVLVEQDWCQADGKQPVCGSTRCHSRRPKGNVLRVI